MNRNSLGSISNSSNNNNNNIVSLTSPLKKQYIVYNPMDNKLLHLLVTENQYLQFIKILSTSRKNANKLLLQSPILDAESPSSTYSHDYQDLLRSFSSDTTGDTNTEIETEDDDSVRRVNKNEVMNLIENLHLQVYSSEEEEGEEEEDGGITFEDLERYEQLLNDFESTREEDQNSNTLEQQHKQFQAEINTHEMLADLSEIEDDSMLEVNNSFTDYIRKKFKDEESSNFLNNPQEFLKKVSKIWKLIPRNLNKIEKSNDINKDQFHEFFVKWKEQHKPLPNNVNNNSDTNLSEKTKLSIRIQRDPDVEVPEEDITEELIEEKIASLLKKEPSSPFEFFYNDKLRELLQDHGNFNMKKKQINSQIMLLWEKVSVLEKARYSSITIDEHKEEVQFSSPSKRSVSYNDSLPTSKLSSPKRSVSSYNPVPASSKIPTLQPISKSTHTILTPPISPPHFEPLTRENSPTRKGLVNSEVRRLNKKKSWGKDDKWL